MHQNAAMQSLKTFPLAIDADIAYINFGMRAGRKFDFQYSYIQSLHIFFFIGKNLIMFDVFNYGQSLGGHLQVHPERVFEKLGEIDYKEVKRMPKNMRRNWSDIHLKLGLIVSQNYPISSNKISKMNSHSSLNIRK